MGNGSRFPVRGNGLASNGAVELRTLHAPCGALACGWSLTGWLGWEVSEVSVYARWGWCYALRGHGLSVLFETQRPQSKNIYFPAPSDPLLGPDVPTVQTTATVLKVMAIQGLSGGCSSFATTSYTFSQLKVMYPRPPHLRRSDPRMLVPFPGSLS